MPFLNKEGLAHFWNHIVARLNGMVARSDLDNLEASLTEQIESIDFSPYETTANAQAKLDTAKAYTDTKTSDLASITTVDNKISSHNTSTSSHNDIRVLITDLTTKLNNFLDVDDTTSDQLSEVLTLIENNKGTLDSLTINKVNVSDIIDNLTTNISSKTLSAAQGVAIKALIDALQEELDGHTHIIDDVNNLQSTLDAKVPISRTINGKALSNDITLSASDVGAASSSHGNHVPATETANNAKFLRNDNTWQTVTPANIGAMVSKPASIELEGASSNGGFIDFHYGQSSEDYTSRIIESSSGSISVNQVSLSSGNIEAKNEYLTGSLYVGGKRSTTDGRTGVAFGASGNVTMQGSSEPTLNFIVGSNTSTNTKILADSNKKMKLYAEQSVSLYPIKDGSIYGIEVQIDSSTSQSVRPNSNSAGVITLGIDAKRFSTAYFTTAASVTSDRNIKKDISSIDERYIELFDKLEPVSYKLVGQNHDRVHLGFISQDVKAIMDEVGISDLEFGGYCRDVKLDAETGKPILDDNGQKTYSYSLRYGEFIALNSKVIQLNRAKIAEQQNKIDEMEKEIATLKITVETLLAR